MRSIILGLGCFALFCANAFADCGSEQVACTASCVASSMFSRQGDGGMGCNMNCLNAATACEQREAQQRQMEEQRQQAQQQRLQQQQQQQQQAAERQAQQARDAKEIAGKQQTVQQAAEIAKRVSAEAAIQQQFDAAMEKGMQALDQKGYITAEYQFKAALKIKPNDIDAKAGLLRANVGAGRRAAALTYANEQLLALAAQPPGADGRSAYAHWLEVLGDNGLTNNAERSQLERIYPFGGGDPVGAAAAFPRANPKSPFLPFVRQIGGVLPAIRADYADRRKDVEIKAVAEGKAAAEVKEAQRPGKVFKDCPDCPEMVVIPAGSYDMGSSSDNSEKPMHRVSVSAFALAMTEVTQAQWQAIMGSNPSHFTDCGDNCPVERVTWNDAQEYLKTLSQRTGKTYRLPSEAEWEYACRAGGRHEYCGGDSIDSVAWYNNNSEFKTHPVAGKQANAFGLYDLSGNVWEWVEDCWLDNYGGAPSDGSARTTGKCDKHVQRGGSWSVIPQVARSAVRNSAGLNWGPAFDDLGFRPARMLP